MADKYLYNNAGVITEKEATVTSAGAGDAGEIPALDAAGLLDVTMMPAGVGPETKVIPCSEALSAGNLVNVYDDTGTTKCRKADATTAGKYANGFVLSAYDSLADATVYFSGMNNQLSGKTGGTRYYLSATPGGITDTAPSASGNVVQYVGTCVSATELPFEEGLPIVLA